MIIKLTAEELDLTFGAAIEQVQEFVMDQFFDVINPIVYDRMEKLYGLTAHEICDRIEQVSTGEYTPYDLMVEQAFVNGQMDLVRQILTHATLP
jgi:hypothetical protein